MYHDHDHHRQDDTVLYTVQYILIILSLGLSAYGRYLWYPWYGASLLRRSPQQLECKNQLTLVEFNIEINEHLTSYHTIRP